MPHPLNENAALALRELGMRTIRELEVPTGILASSKEDIYGCIFGRDSLITALKLLTVNRVLNDDYIFGLIKKILVHLADLQGNEVNVESGEEPGKCIHEYRVDNHAHLTQYPEKPWHVYPDNTMRNFDSVDSTPLFLIALFRYFQQSGDQELVTHMERRVRLSLQWILEYGDSNGDGFIDYQLHPDRTKGGLVAQSWMDSHETLFHEDGESLRYPLAPVEVQAYVYAALQAWAKYFCHRDPLWSDLLKQRAKNLKKLFNEKYILEENAAFGLACALDGNGKPLTSQRSSMGHILWAAGQERESILDEKHISRLVKRLLSRDLFEPNAGMRTLSTSSRNFQAMSYHNGSIWPHDNSLIIEGLENFDYTMEAALIRHALLKALHYFQTPVELFVFENEQYTDYRSPSGQTACKKQAWSAASMLCETLLIQRESSASPLTLS